MKRYLFGIGVFLSAGIALSIDLGDVADGVYQPVKFVTVLMRYACYAVGFALCMGAISQFRLHRINPKLTPLLTPVFLLILGLAALFFPYLSTMFGNSWSAEDQSARGGRGGELIQGEAPLRRPTERQAPLPSAPTYWGDSYK